MPMDEGHETPSRIERLIHSPTVRSTYASLVTHVLMLIGLALLLIPTRKDMRPRPIVIAMADAEAIDVVPGHAAGGGETGSDEIEVPLAAEPAPPIDETVAVDPPIVPLIEPMAIAVESPAIVPSANHPTPVESVQAIAASLASQPRRGSTIPGQAPFEGRRGPARPPGHCGCRRPARRGTDRRPDLPGSAAGALGRRLALARPRSRGLNRLNPA
jgi:hypothetical protein